MRERHLGILRGARPAASGWIPSPTDGCLVLPSLGLRRVVVRARIVARVVVDVGVIVWIIVGIGQIDIGQIRDVDVREIDIGKVDVGRIGKLDVVRIGELSHCGVGNRYPSAQHRAYEHDGDEAASTRVA
jgi:hypothetical protein